jgi:hypothetical protein
VRDGRRLSVTNRRSLRPLSPEQDGRRYSSNSDVTAVDDGQGES